MRRGKERERLCFLSWCESRLMLCSYREKLPSTASRAMSRTDKTLLTQTKPKTWKKEQNPHHGHHAPACGSEERQKGHHVSHGEGNTVLPTPGAFLSSLLPCLVPPWPNNLPSWWFTAAPFVFWLVQPLQGCQGSSTLLSYSARSFPA